MKDVIYWSPCLGNVGTIKSTLNSAISLKKYSNKEYNVIILDVCGEWKKYIDVIEKNNLIYKELNFDYFKYLPKIGFFFSRLSYILVFLLSFIPLYKFLKKRNNCIFVAHLITSLPLFINFLYKNNIKFVLRISGFPKLNIMRKYFWKISLKKIYKVTCPTYQLMEKIKSMNLVENSKLNFLPDAIINMSDFIKKKNKQIKLPTNKKFILNVGRLTKQKNQIYLINETKEFLKKNVDFDLIILGDGENKLKLLSSIKKNKLENRVFLIGFKDNPYPYFKNASYFILSSLWEEVGFVLVEAALSNLYLLSSDCPNGPSELLLNGKAGFLFKSNEKDSLKNKLKELNKLDYKMKVNAKKNSIKYTLFRHHKNLRKILNNENNS